MNIRMYFNSLINELLEILVKIEEEEHATLFLYSMLDLQDNLIINLSHFTKLNMNYVAHCYLMSLEGSRWADLLHLAVE